MANYSKTTENLTLNDKVKFDNKGGAILGVLEGPIADPKHPTRNGRLYNERLWENVLSNDIVREQFANGGILGELDHPKDRDDICTEKVAVIMPEPPTKNKNGEYIGKFNILDTPCGRIVYTLAKAGFKLGVSSRGNGDYDEYTGEVDPDSYDFTCFDVVVLPAVKDARMKLVTEDFKKQKTFKTLLKEQLDRSSDEDKKIMKETLKNIKENLDNPQDQANFKKNNPDFSKNFNFNKYGKYFDKDGKLVDEKGYLDAIKNLGDAGAAIKEAYEHHKCVICGKDFDGWGNNAWPVKDGICCDECNQEEVIPARLAQLYKNKSKLKEDKEEEIPDISVKDDTLTVDIDKEPEVEITDGEKEPCEECQEFDTKLKDFLDAFLKTQDLETEGEEEKDLFVKLFHETFPELDCCAEKHDDIDDEVADTNSELAAKDTGADDDVVLLEQLQNTLKENRLLKKELKNLQAEKAVGNSKVTKLNEELNQFKSIAALAGKKALNLKSYENENLKLKEQFNSLKENLNKAQKDLSSKQKDVEDSKSQITKLSEENKNLKEQLDAKIQSSTKLEQNYQKSTKLIEKYKNFAHEIANRYIDSKALALGVSSNEIKNRLSESYTLDEVDEVCEDLQEYSINISKLPFQVNKPGSMRARLREDRSRDPLKDMDSQYDDTVDDYLLDLAGLRK